MAACCRSPLALHELADELELAELVHHPRRLGDRLHVALLQRPAHRPSAAPPAPWALAALSRRSPCACQPVRVRRLATMPMLAQQAVLAAERAVPRDAGAEVSAAATRSGLPGGVQQHVAVRRPHTVPSACRSKRPARVSIGPALGLHGEEAGRRRSPGSSGLPVCDWWHPRRLFAIGRAVLRDRLSMRAAAYSVHPGFPFSRKSANSSVAALEAGACRCWPGCWRWCPWRAAGRRGGTGRSVGGVLHRVRSSGWFGSAGARAVPRAQALLDAGLPVAAGAPVAARAQPRRVSATSACRRAAVMRVATISGGGGSKRAAGQRSAVSRRPTSGAGGHRPNRATLENAAASGQDCLTTSGPATVQPARRQLNTPERSGMSCGDGGGQPELQAEVDELFHSHSLGEAHAAKSRYKPAARRS